MKKAAIFLIIITICSMLIPYCFSASIKNETDVETIAKSVLKIYIYDNVNADYEDYIATGSGFVAFNNSTLITNYHVIEGAKKILASDDDNNIYELNAVLSSDEDADVAILGFSEATSLVPLELFPDDQLKRGAPVLAIGSPKGLKNTVSDGVISYQFVEDSIPRIQFTAPISPGSSGGVLLNDDGKVIGITSSSYKSKDEFGEDTNAQNLNFAVNISVAQAMYNAWDGSKHSLSNYPNSAKMDYSGVYKHNVPKEVGGTENNEIEDSKETALTNSWICLNCGKENSTKFCLECGAEKPYWTCSCGRVNSSNKFCGDCGRSQSELLESFNSAMNDASQHNYQKAIDCLENLGLYDSGSFETVAGKHTVAAPYINKLYYDEGIYLQSINADHNMIIECFIKAGDYGDSKEQILAENARYAKQHYDLGNEQLANGEYAFAIESYKEAGNYLDSARKILSVYYAWGNQLLYDKQYESSREKFGFAGDYEDAETMILKTYYVEASDKLAVGKYDEAIELFEKAGDYSDSRDQIKGIHFIKGNLNLENGDYAAAKIQFKEAGDYPGVAEKLEYIDVEEKKRDYEAGKKALETNDYIQAKEYFTLSSGYQDSDDLYADADIFEMNEAFNKLNHDNLTSVDRNALNLYANRLKKYPNKEKAVVLYKKINYTLGKDSLKKGYKNDVLIQFAEAGDYEDAADLLLEARKNEYEALIQYGNYNQAYDYYNQYLIPLGCEQEHIILNVGDKGSFASEIFNLAKPTGIKGIPQNEDEYKEKYTPIVQQLEEHFNLNPDGKITLSEYLQINNTIYPGMKGSTVKALFEKLTDLGYIRKLADSHDVYEAKYSNSIISAEKELGLQADGIITKEEYNYIMSLNVDSPDKPGSLIIQSSGDTVTISWQKVDGAVCYEVKRDDTVLGTTTKTTWVQKNSPTGSTYSFQVKAKKYTVDSDYAINHYTVPQYYVPVSPAQLVKNYSSYKGRYVKLTSRLTVVNWKIKAPDGSFKATTAYIFQAKNTSGYTAYLLCHSGKSSIEIELKDYSSWSWESNSMDLLSAVDMNKKVTISIEGVVQDGSVPSSSIPSVLVDSIQFNY